MKVRAVKKGTAKNPIKGRLVKKDRIKPPYPGARYVRRGTKKLST